MGATSTVVTMSASATSEVDTRWANGRRRVRATHSATRDVAREGGAVEKIGPEPAHGVATRRARFDLNIAPIPLDASLGVG
jgi:hypothetical protein